MNHQPNPIGRAAVAFAATIAAAGVFIACAALSGSSAKVDAFGVSSEVHGPWVPDPAPTIYASSVYVCDEAPPRVSRRDAGTRDAAGE